MIDRLAACRKLAFLRPGDWFIKNAAALASIGVVSLSGGRTDPDQVLAAVLFSIPAHCFAFGLNYYLERDVDAVVGKHRVAGVGPLTAWPILILLAAGCLAVAAAYGSWVTVAVAAGTVAIATVYSAQPIYLKARGIASVVSQAVALAVPTFWFFITVSDYREPLPIAYLSVWVMLLTAKGALIHQIVDHDNDVRTGLRTFSVGYGRRAAITAVGSIVVLLYLWAILALAVFSHPVDLIVLLLVAFSNPPYQAPDRDRDAGRREALPPPLVQRAP